MVLIQILITNTKARRNYSTYEKWDLASAQQYIRGFVLSVKQFMPWGVVCPFSNESAVLGGRLCKTTYDILFKIFKIRSE